MNLHNFKAPKIDIDLGSLYKIFASIFSMKNLKNEFPEQDAIEVLNTAKNADHIIQLITGDPNERARDIDNIASTIDESTISLLPLDPTETSTQDLLELLSKIPRTLRKKALFVMQSSEDTEHEIELNTVLTSSKAARAYIFKSDQDLIKYILEKLASKAPPAARQYKGLRDLLAQKYIVQTSKENASLAFASAIPSSIPLLGTLISLFTSAGDTVVITANQLRLCLRLSGIYGLKLDFFKRTGEVLPVIACSFGWKSLAKITIGMIPIAGPVLKAAIAFTGTYLTGIAAKKFYRDGILPTTQQMKQQFNAILEKQLKKRTKQ